MKKVMMVMALAVGMCCVVPFAQAAEKKIGYVDLSRLFDEYYKTKDYDKVLEVKHKEFEEASKTKVDAIREEQGKLAVLKEDKKAEKEKEIEKMKADLLEFDRQEKTTLTQERNEKIREILLEIEQVVSQYAEKEGYSVILNDRVLVYGHQSMNLTEDVLKILNANKK